MANDYCTNTEIKAAMPDGNWGSSYDTLLTALATRASRALDGLLKRMPGAFYVSADATYYFTGSGDAELWIGELAAAPTSVAVAESGDITSYTAWAATDYHLWPYNALSEGMPYQRLDIDLLNGTKALWYAYPKAVKIVGKFGFSAAIPDEIKEAAIIQASRWFKRGQQAYADTGAITELGQLHYTKQIDPDIAAILDIPRFHKVTI